MAHGHRKPAIAKSGSHFIEGSLLPPDPIPPYGEVKINYGRVQVRIPFAGIEPTARQMISLSGTELRRFGVDLPDVSAWTLKPLGADDSLEFELTAA